MKKQLLIMIMLVSLGVIQNTKAHTQAKPIPDKTDIISLMEELLMLHSAAGNERKDSFDTYNTLVANTSTVDLEVKVGEGDTWEDIPRNTYRIFFYATPQLSIRKSGEAHPQKILSLHGNQDNAITLIESVDDDDSIKGYKSGSPQNIQYDIFINKLNALEKQESRLARQYAVENDHEKEEQIFQKFMQMDHLIEQLIKDFESTLN